MKKDHVFWIVAITAILSIFHAVGMPLTYSQNPFIHGLGNFFFNNPIFRVWQMASIFITVYLIIKKVPVYIVIIPAVSAFMGLPFLIIFYMYLGGGNFLEPVIHLALAVYSVSVLAKTK